jgi:hypothetical protein
VFISSTSLDLHLERQAIENALRQMRDASIIAMEFFGSRPEAPKEVCLDEVGKSDVYIGIFAERYGHVDQASGLSITELEYRAARSLNLPCLIYLKRPSAQEPARFQEPDPSAHEKLRNLKADLQAAHVVTFFEDSENLATRVVLDLHNLLSQNRLPAQPQRDEPQKPITPQDLHIVLITRLSLDELQDLCFRVNVKSGYLAGDTLPAKSRALIEYIDNRQELDRLVSELRRMRPDINVVKGAG